MDNYKIYLVKKIFSFYFLFGLVIMLFLLARCKKDSLVRPETPYQPPTNIPDTLVQDSSYLVPNINLNNWKVTLPIANSSGSPLEVTPPAILDYANNTTLSPFMYNDYTDGSIVFYTYPGATTTNTTYSRTELREQMDPGSNNTNWTFAEGGNLKGTLSVPEISKDQSGNFHRTIIMQIHGRLTDAQKNLINASDNNAPPVLKIYWQDNKIYVRTKELINENATYVELLETDAWEDDNGRFFSKEVGTDKFTLEVDVSDGKMTVSLDDDETFVYDGFHMQKWGAFENYFKAGNYLGTTDQGAYSRVKYYALEVSH